MTVELLLRSHIAAMEAYTPIVPFDVLSARLGRAPSEIIKLDANENPYGPSPKVLEALANLEYPHIYPDPESTALRAALAKDTGLPAEYLMAGAGADELIDLIMRAFLNPGDAIINCPPTFGMYPFDAGLNAARVISVTRREDFSVDVEGIERVLLPSPPTPLPQGEGSLMSGSTSIPAGERNQVPVGRISPPRPLGEGRSEGAGTGQTKLLFLTSPNNPDGSVIADADFYRLLKLPVMVVLDEAYVEFHGASRIQSVLEYDNLIVLRTFSKRAGLAGMRVGYGAFPLWLMPHLWKIKQPYNVTVASSVAANAALDDAAYLKHVVQLLTDERERLYTALAEIPYLKPYPSRANYILCRVIGRDARQLKLALEREGILVRYYTTKGLQDCIRISVGKPEHTAALIEALDAWK